MTTPAEPEVPAPDAAASETIVTEFPDFPDPFATGAGLPPGIGARPKPAVRGAYSRPDARIPILEQALRSPEAAQLQVQIVLPSGRTQEAGHVPVEAAVEDLIDLYKRPGVFRLLPVRNDGTPVNGAEWAQKEISPLHPYFEAAGYTAHLPKAEHGGMSHADLLTLLANERQAGRADAMGAMGMVAESQKNLDAREEKLFTREDRIEEKRADLIRAAAADQNQSITSIFGLFMAQQAEQRKADQAAAERAAAAAKTDGERQQALLLAMLTAQNNRPSVMQEAIALAAALAPVLGPLVGAAVNALRPPQPAPAPVPDPIGDFTKMANAVRAIAPPAAPQKSLTDTLTEVKLIKDTFGGGGGNSDSVEIAKIVAETVGDLAGTAATVMGHRQPGQPGAPAGKAPAGTPAATPTKPSKGELMRLAASLSTEDAAGASSERLRAAKASALGDRNNLVTSADLMAAGLPPEIAGKLED